MNVGWKSHSLIADVIVVGLMSEMGREKLLRILDCSHELKAVQSSTPTAVALNN